MRFNGVTHNVVATAHHFLIKGSRWRCRHPSAMVLALGSRRAGFHVVDGAVGVRVRWSLSGFPASGLFTGSGLFVSHHLGESPFPVPVTLHQSVHSFFLSLEWRALTGRSCGCQTLLNLASLLWLRTFLYLFSL